MTFTFFERQRVLLPISKIADREFNAFSRTELAKLQNLSLFFPGVGGRLGVIWTFGFFGKSKARWNFLFPFLKIVHQKGLLGRRKYITKFCNCRRILDIYSQGLLLNTFMEKKSYVFVFLFDFLALPLIFTLLVVSTSHFLNTAIKISYFSSNVNLCLSSTSMKTLKFSRGKDSALCWFFFSSKV